MRTFIGIFLTVAILTSLLGCQTTSQHHVVTPPLPPPDLPRELSKVAMPVYTVEPPDVLIIEAVRLVPTDKRLQPGDIMNVQINVIPIPEVGISAPIAIQPNGNVNLGPAFGGNLPVAGLMIEEAEARIKMRVHQQYDAKSTVISVTLGETVGSQQIAGNHLVGQDGMVTLGSYGGVSVVGLTLQQAREKLETHLRMTGHFREAVLAVDVLGYNSRVYYVITEGAGMGDGVQRFPITGNETVLDAIANINGLTQVSSKRIWIARPAPLTEECQIIPVDWQAVTARGVASTNYQIMPGDRIFVAENELVAFDTNLAKVLAPLERMAGFTLLTTGTATRLSGRVLKGGGNQNRGSSGSGF